MIKHLSIIAAAPCESYASLLLNQNRFSTLDNIYNVEGREPGDGVFEGFSVHLAHPIKRVMSGFSISFVKPPHTTYTSLLSYQVLSEKRSLIDLHRDTSFLAYQVLSEKKSLIELHRVSSVYQTNSRTSDSPSAPVSAFEAVIRRAVCPFPTSIAEGIITYSHVLPVPGLREVIESKEFFYWSSIGSLSYSNAMSFWTCSACTYVNQGNTNKCDMCEQIKKPPSASMQSHVPFLSSNSLHQDDVYKWGCRACTFLNKESVNRCEICGTSRSSIPLDSFVEIDSTLEEDTEGAENRMTRFWPLRSCTSSKSESQECLQTRRTTNSSVGSNNSATPQERPNRQNRKRNYEDDVEILSSNEPDCGLPSAVSNAMLHDLHCEKMLRNSHLHGGNTHASLSPQSNSLSRNPASDSSAGGGNSQTIVILTYNVWFREDLEVDARMNAIGAIILDHNPHFICLQEVTPNIYRLFQCSPWWGRYKCSVSPTMAGKRAYFCLLLCREDGTLFHRKAYSNSVMGRELCIAESKVGAGKQLFVATTHLESPCPAPPTWDQMFSPERVSQAKQAFDILMTYKNVVFGGDMNWDDKLDGAPPLPTGWHDVWLMLRPNEDGLTYDSKQNPLLTGSRLRKRLDRFFCHLQDFSLESIEMVGTQAIPGVMFEKEIKVKRESKKVQLPVLPSDHFGLLLKIAQKEEYK
ncbi:hypothetical protein KP509_08G019700 [Ceratopteris richardii]|uniref:RanBP2-type domain-containing protein n=1 Tax=Ceratopteris richardii TaxID=49495 RepID=A0A8T2UEL8_CERRI|nr:hypothetical protein KP509_08G019700 [Ceratopteris richardii]